MILFIICLHYSGACIEQVRLPVRRYEDLQTKVQGRGRQRQPQPDEGDL